MKTIILITLISLTGTIKSQIPENYYNKVNSHAGMQQLQGEALKNTLHETIKNHKKYPYTHKSKTDVWDILKEADQSPENTKKIILVYTLREQKKKIKLWRKETLHRRSLES